jgi:hypothetical protein
VAFVSSCQEADAFLVFDAVQLTIVGSVGNATVLAFAIETRQKLADGGDGSGSN